MMKVKPRGGFIIRDPQRGDLIEPEGRFVPKTTYWLHRLRDGDVVLVSDELETPKIITKAARKKQVVVSTTEEADAKDSALKGGAIEE
jgi:hypothetical protein